MPGPFFIMKYHVYVLKSMNRRWIYVGMTTDIKRRFNQHQLGQSKSTAPWRPFCLIFTEEFDNSLIARKREKYLKTASGKRFIKAKYRIELDKCI